MATEQEVLKKISENNGKAHIQFIAKQAGISSDYARLICTDLVRKGLLEQALGRDWYQITKKTKKKARQKQKDNPGKDDPGEEGLILEQIISKGINIGIGQVEKQVEKAVKAVSSIIKKLKGRIKEQN